MFKLKEIITSETGIPHAFQQLFHQNRLMQSINDLPHDANIQLKIKVMGGENHCELCFGTASVFCECSGRFHRHPKRSSHTLDTLSNDSLSSNEKNNCSQSSDNSFGSDVSMHDTMLVATLAEKFGLTSFKTFQRTVIDAVLEGRDTL